MDACNMKMFDSQNKKKREAKKGGVKMRKTLVIIGVMLVLGLATTEAGAAIVPISWTGPDSFATASITFNGFTADSIVDITGPGAVHGHGGTAPFSMDVLLNGSFLNIFSGTAPATPASTTLDSLVPPALTFSAGQVSGLRLTTSGTGEFHSFSGEVFTFNSPGVTPPTPPSGVPEPSTLFLLSSCLIGFVAFRGKFKKV